MFSRNTFDVRHEFEILGNIPKESEFEANIDDTEKMELEIPVEFTGDDSQTWLIGIDGPLSRVAQTEDVQSLEDGSVITLEIDPNGLLSDGMIVRGEVILASDSGHNYHIDVVLTAGSEEESTIEEWTSPAKLIPIALALACLWVVLGINSPSRQVPSDEQEAPTSTVYSDDPAFVDPFSESY